MHAVEGRYRCVHTHSAKHLFDDALLVWKALDPAEGVHPLQVGFGYDEDEQNGVQFWLAVLYAPFGWCEYTFFLGGGARAPPSRQPAISSDSDSEETASVLTRSVLYESVVPYLRIVAA
jgi:hypothetical protein